MIKLLILILAATPLSLYEKTHVTTYPVMGCQISVGTTASRRSKGLNATRSGVDGALTSGTVDGRDPKSTGADNSVSLAYAVPAVKPVTYNDYRGFQVTMVNGTLAKINNICRWLDTALDKREKNGGWCMDVLAESVSSGKMETSFYCESIVQASHHVTHYCGQERANGVEYFAEVHSQQVFEKSAVSRTFDCPSAKFVYNSRFEEIPRQSDITTTQLNKETSDSGIPNGREAMIRYSPTSSEDGGRLNEESERGDEGEGNE
ncbi:hypothetical protein, conserved [Trypanosoma brucei gambiense DAL972]|uniref:Uncharacterized protein n=3 Tax=Trypanosoma brucei TaxID=5691 RepID=Q38E28_TRYB2|nr:hypothetical protein, conserved [Trypanosoma brucei gambiense DAL972]XP_827272.1 hypothetical protein, conserved [Trypanosoma brucei brucei TREU927]EAN76942.1 hypothetical protein, conserved [Trypanosoma brucei brucei TREU927]RHW70277.1 hypothetical protein DPX39_090053900 [Trypanosoma brucei equiperdum]CBH14479.1 hypothetical protein, conserved [Trypanosoma brucei gambiense DAL972]|eukprot:XP_011776745.1 hypothetical protein, conserved [Trypanosoma brucei gambiense DAL972]